MYSASYDADGNLLTESGDVNRQVTWTSYNQPSQIVGDSATETFLYGPDRSRLVTAITRGSDNVTTTYIDGLFEQVYDSATGNLTYRHYILAGGARVGVETVQADIGDSGFCYRCRFTGCSDGFEHTHNGLGFVFDNFQQGFGSPGRGTLSLFPLSERRGTDAKSGRKLIL